MNIHGAKFTQCPSCCHFISLGEALMSLFDSGPLSSGPLSAHLHTLCRSRKRFHPTVGRKIISGRLIARREQSGRFGDGTKQEFPLMKSGSAQPPPALAANAVHIRVWSAPPRGTGSHTSIGRGTLLRVKTHMRASSMLSNLHSFESFDLN